MINVGFQAIMDLNENSGVFQILMSENCEFNMFYEINLELWNIFDHVKYEVLFDWS